MRAYLSGGMEYASDGGKGWRDEMQRWLNENLSHDVFNPVVETEKFLSEKYPEVDFREIKKTSPEKFKEIISEIVQRDLKAISSCDYVICFWDEGAEKGAGTQGEVTVAKLLNKPVFLVSKFHLSKIPSWIIGCADEIFKDFDELKDFLLKKFKPAYASNSGGN